MAFRITGKYVASCNCSLVCPCPVDAPPTGPNGTCTGVAIFDISQGNLDDTDLSGVKFVLYNHFPSNLTSGNWKVGLIVDDGASDDQAAAIERIGSGQVGGPFAEFMPLIGEFLGVDRASVTLSADGAGSIGGVGDFSFEPVTGPTGAPVKVSGAMFAFAPEYELAKTSGSMTTKAGSIDAVYGETSDFDWSSEMAADQPHGRG